MSNLRTASGRKRPSWLSNSGAAAGIMLVAALSTAACSSHEDKTVATGAILPAGDVVTIQSTTLRSHFNAAGTAEPITQATLSTKLMGTVVEVYVQEGDLVRRGQPLLRIDARDLAAKAAQVDAGIAQAEAVQGDALANAQRVRALYAQDAAPKAQLDAVEAGLARAEAAVRAAQAGAGELSALRDYAVVRAPDNGLVTRRMVDRGAFAAPGSPLMTIQNASVLRVRANASPDVVRGLTRGARIQAIIENVPVSATIEAVVPGMSGNMYVVNALVPNKDGRFLAGSAATLAIPLQERSAIAVPALAIVRQGDLTGVYTKAGNAFAIRWVRLGETAGSSVEVLSGIAVGDQILVPRSVAGVN